jgi:hypothetical protein
MANFAHCPSQEGWIDKGASELAIRIGGYESAPPASFAAHPDVQLNSWSNQPSDLTRHYQASYLFMRYVAERAGGWDVLPALLGPCVRGEGLFSAFLARTPIAPDLDSLFSDWTVANLLQDPSVGGGKYGYGNGGFRAALTGRATYATPFLGSVPQFAANYVELPNTGGSVSFSGDALVPLLAAPMDSTSAVWWSNRGDSLDSRLTRQLDLTGTDEVTLRFSAWYDTEEHFDYVYLSASRDGGRTWQVLPGQRTLSDQATGNNYGKGWSGSSGPDWLDEEVDLTPFAGSVILLRFEYVTDQSYNSHGFALKDVRIPQVGIDEPGAAERGWISEGWVHVDAPIPERWNLKLVRWTASGVSVEPVDVDADGSATFPLVDKTTRQTLVIAPTAPRTLMPGNYSVSVTPAPTE